MYKIVIIFISFVTFSFATELSLTTQDIRSYPITKGNVGIKGEYDFLNDGFDIFGVIDDDIGKSVKHGTLGNLNALNFTLYYGLQDYISLLYNLKYQNIDYASTNLKNLKNEFVAKINIYQNPSSIIDTYTLDVGLSFDSGNNINIKNSSLGISKMDDLSDGSFYLRFLAGTKIRSSVLNFFMTLGYSSIDTKLNSIDYGRSEVALKSGFEYTIELDSYIIESGYKYIRLFNRDVKNNQEKSNHIFNINLSKVISNDLLLFFGLNYFAHQYNGVIPYLYNEKTSSEFSQKYGYASFGFVYNFNWDGLNKRW